MVPPQKSPGLEVLLLPVLGQIPIPGLESLQGWVWWGRLMSTEMVHTRMTTVLKIKTTYPYASLPPSHPQKRGGKMIIAVSEYVSEYDDQTRMPSGGYTDLEHEASEATWLSFPIALGRTGGNSPRSPEQSAPSGTTTNEVSPVCSNMTQYPGNCRPFCKDKRQVNLNMAMQP